MKTLRPPLGAFNQGSVPTIACFNQAKTPLGVGLDALVAAMQDTSTATWHPSGGTPARLVRTAGSARTPGRSCSLDNADQPGALGLSRPDAEGLPLSRCFVKTTIANRDLVSVSASHSWSRCWSIRRST